MAVIVDRLTEENLQDLLSLKKEVGILGFEGFEGVVLFTSSHDSELRILKSIEALPAIAVVIW